MLNTLKVWVGDILNIFILFKITTKKNEFRTELNICESWFCSASSNQAKSPIQSIWFMSILINQTKHRQYKNHHLCSCTLIDQSNTKYLKESKFPCSKVKFFKKCKEVFPCLEKIFSHKRKQQKFCFIYNKKFVNLWSIVYFQEK